MNVPEQVRSERGTHFFLIALCVLGYARLYMLRDVYADDNCWLFGIYLGYDLQQFLATGFLEMRREPLGVFLYFFFLPFRFLDNPYLVWHSAVLATQIGTTLLLYGLVRRLSGERRLAALAAAALVVLPLDHALPYLSSFNYRAGLLLALASLYLTDRAAERGAWGWEMAAAMLLTALAEYALSEATVALEPARLVLLWYRLAPSRSVRDAGKETLRWMAPFVILMLPLVAYKLLARPYGMYAGMYEASLSNLLDWKALARAARLFLLGEWRVLLRFASHGAALTPIVALAAALLVLAALLRVTRAAGHAPGSPRPGAQRLVVFAVTVLVAQLGLFLYAGRGPNLGFDSTHAIFAQLGYASLLGLAADRLLDWGSTRRRLVAAAATLAAIGGAGIYFNNLRLDVFAAASKEQDHFWQAFQQRFPELPRAGDWLIDARPRPYRRNVETFYEWEDLHATYDLEFVLNRLYAPASGRGRRHRVYTPEEARNDPGQLAAARASKSIERLTHYGRDRLDAAAMTVVYYRDGRLLVNEEILKQDPGVPYRHIADKRVPSFARPARGN